MLITGEDGNLSFRPIWGQQKSDFLQLVPETSNGTFCVSYAEGSLSCNFELNTAILTDLRSAKIQFFTTRPIDLEWCVLCQ